jgi:hypothetical protein
MYCEIYVKGYLAADWSDWIGGLQITNLSNGDSLLAGELVDQTALFGVLNHLHNLNLPLLTLTTAADQRSPPSGSDHPSGVTAS